MAFLRIAFMTDLWFWKLSKQIWSSERFVEGLPLAVFEHFRKRNLPFSQASAPSGGTNLSGHRFSQTALLWPSVLKAAHGFDRNRSKDQRRQPVDKAASFGKGEIPPRAYSTHAAVSERRGGKPP